MDITHAISISTDVEKLQTLLAQFGKLPKNKQQQAFVTLLRCRLFQCKTMGMAPSERERELVAVRQDIHYRKRFPSVYDEYLANFKAYVLHSYEEDPPIELYAERMHAIAKDLGTENLLYNHALYHVSEMTVLASHFHIGRELNQEMLDVTEANAKRNPGRDYSEVRLTVMMRLMICIFESEHRVDEHLLSQCLTLTAEKPDIMDSNNAVHGMLNLYKAIAEGRYEAALKILEEKQAIAHKRGFQYLFETDAAVTVCWRSGMLDMAIRITDMQTENSKRAINVMDANYLREMGLDEDFQSADRANALLVMEQQMGKDETASKNEELEALRQALHNDSLLIARELAERAAVLSKAENEKALTESWMNQEHERLFTRIRNYQMILGICSALFLLITIPYALRVKRMNKRLLKKHQLLRIATDKANQSNRLKVFFLQNTSHDIRNPLGAIGSFCQMLTDMIASKGDNDAMECANIVNENTVLLTRMMDSILDISSLESGRRPIQWADTYPVGIAQELILIRQTALAKPVKILLESDVQEDYILRSDPTRFKQLLSHLLSNACKFTAEGTITIRLKVNATDFLLEVEDTGPGIPSDKTEEIFSRFVKLDQYIPGTGLGLSLCKVISEHLLGRLYVDTTYDKGARFIFSQPLDAEAHYAEKAPTETNIYK